MTSTHAQEALASSPQRRALVVGHFSTVGDIEVLRQVERQLTAASMPYDIGPYLPQIAASIDGSVEIREVDPARYSHLIAVCGPFHRAYLTRHSIGLRRFAHCVRIGVNLSMIDDLDAWNPFHALLGRDSDQWQRPDLSFLEPVERVPVVGLCLVHRQREYGQRQSHGKASDLLRRLAQRANVAVLELDTEWPGERNASKLSSPAQFESICARLDVMLTTRLHGTVLALKNGVPAIAIDPIIGGGKVSRQAKAIGWPEAYRIDEVTDEALDAALARCLSEPARVAAGKVAERARATLRSITEDFQSALLLEPQDETSFAELGMDLPPVPRANSFRKTGRKLVAALHRKVSEVSQSLFAPR